MRSALLNVMVKAAVRAGRSLVHDFNEVENLQVSVKGPADFVSAADQRAEKILHESLSAARSDYGFLMEESGAIPGKNPNLLWIIDPLDGTTNFLSGIPLFAISIGLQDHGVLRAGVVYNPVGGELFAAERGRGAFLEDRRLRVSSTRDLSRAVVGSGLPGPKRRQQIRAFYRAFDTLLMRSAGARSTGSAALDIAWTAAGRFDAFWGRGYQPWDVAGALVIASEAGAHCLDFSGRPATVDSPNYLICNPHLRDTLLGLITTANDSTNSDSDNR